MIRKDLLRSDRLRTIPPDGFSWTDRRFVRDGFMALLAPPQILLYGFLCAVADRRGLSFWSDVVIGRILRLSRPALSAARMGLVQADLVAYRYPLYQVLSLPQKPRFGLAPPPAATSDPRLRPGRRRGYPVGAARLFQEIELGLLAQASWAERDLARADDPQSQAPGGGV